MSEMNDTHFLMSLTDRESEPLNALVLTLAAHCRIVDCVDGPWWKRAFRRWQCRHGMHWRRLWHEIPCPYCGSCGANCE
jgi:hypothetical protein